MKKEWVLLVVTLAITLAVALGAIKLFAPNLIGGQVAIDRRVVQLEEKAPPFFDLVLNRDDLAAPGGMINDPVIGHRRVVMVPENAEHNAPFDLLGFRNRAVPPVADVVTIGDSQTVGLHTPIDGNWPNRLQAELADGNISVYNMSVGGWGAVQYLYMFEKAMVFRPRLIIVAFYTGNDANDSLHIAYHFDRWKSLRSQEAMPERAPSAWPPKPEDVWTVAFADGVQTGFTAKTRLAVNNRAYPGTLEGYRIMAEAARRMDAMAAENGVEVLYTIIPTKELAFAAKIRAEGLKVPDDYLALIRNEAENLNQLSATLKGLSHGHYVDVVSAMQRAALGPEPLYPTNSDGHPSKRGYQVIAKVLATHSRPLLPAPFTDGIATRVDLKQPDKRYTYLIRDGAVWMFSSPEVFLSSGWQWDPKTIREVTLRDLAGLKNAGVINRGDPKRFGPRPSGGE